MSVSEEFEKSEIAQIIGVMFDAKAAMKTSGVPHGQMPCPKCKTGTVTFRRAPNGHSRGCCSTPECLTWIE